MNKNGLTDEELKAAEIGDNLPEDDVIQVETVVAETDIKKIPDETVVAETDIKKIPDEEAPSSVIFQSEKPIDLKPYYDKLREEKQAAKTSLAKKYNDGLIDVEEYEQGKEKIDSDYETKKESFDNVKIAQIQNAVTIEREWKKTQDIFFTQNPQFQNRALFAALKAEYDSLASDATYTNKNAAELLELAANNVKAVINPSLSFQTTGKSQNKIPEKDKVQIPITLANIPAAAINTEEEGEFSYLEKLSPLEVEKAIMAMNKAQRRRFESTL